MNENVNENIEGVTGSVSPSNGDSLDSDTSVSSGDAGTSSVMGSDSIVSDGNIVFSTLSDGETTSQVVIAAEIIPYLEKIEYNQTAMIFIILMIWLERTIKIAVRKFVGRELEG